MTRTSGRRSDPKLKKSYTLSADSIEFLEAMRKKRRASSISSVLEEILQAVRREQGKAALDRAVSDYYTSMSQSEVEEQIRWGEFTLHEFPNEGP